MGGEIMFRACLVLLPAVWLLAAAAGDDAAKKEIEKLRGKWTAQSIEFDGKPLPADGARKFRFVFKGDEATVEDNAEIQKEYARITFKLDPSTTPRCVDMTVGEGVQKGVTIEGIYELKEDEFKICCKLAARERPSEFSAPAGSGRVLVVLRREK
jgi:uncharacterized protein (TIGR03067 family)